MPDYEPSRTAIVIEEFKPVTRNSLRGFARVRLPSGMILHDVGIYTKDGVPWAAPPSKPMIGSDGTQIRRDNKPAYSPIVAFASKELRDRFSAAVIQALQASHPDALS